MGSSKCLRMLWRGRCAEGSPGGVFDYYSNVFALSRIWAGSKAAVTLGAAALLLSGCAVKPRYPAGEALLKGETVKLPPRPDSLRAELELTAFAGGRKSSVSAAFSGLPRTKYKLDLFGLPGMVAASFLWQQGQRQEPEHWTLVMFDRESFVEGEGEHVEFGNLGIREVSVHDIFSFLWGDFFPGYSAGVGGALPGDFQGGGDGTLHYSARGQRWTALLESGTGLVRGAVREDSAFRMEFSEYKVMKGRPVPRKARLFSRSGLVLEILVKSLEDNPHWRRDPFFVKVPKGFQKVDRGPENAYKD